MEKRAEIIIYGRVQKAGFRDFIDEAAFDLGLNGYVKNLNDGTVCIVCEGDEDSIRNLLDRVNITQYPIRVEHIDVLYKEPTGEYRVFDIIREEDLTAATYERMDAAVRYMREMNSDLGQKIDAVGTKVDAVGDKVDAVGTKVDAVGDKVDQSRIEITSEVRLNRDDFRSHLDERISVLEHELAQIKAKIML
jgi:acylphosphatase